MQVTVRHCLPWGSFISYSFDMDLDADVDLLQDVIANKSNIPKKKQILKYKRDGLTFKLVPHWPLSHYEFSNRSIVYLEERQVVKEGDEKNEKDFADMKMKEGYFSKLGLLGRQVEEEEKVWKRISVQSQEKSPQNEFNIKNYARFRSEDFEACKENPQTSWKGTWPLSDSELTESLIQEVKANNIRRVMSTLIGLGDRYATLFDKKEKQEAIEAKAKRIINQKGADGWSAFHWAVFLGYIDIIAELLNLGADLSAQTEDCWTPLQLAVDNNHIESTYRDIKIFIEKRKVNINEITSKGTALHLAAKNARTHILVLLLEEGADPNIKTIEQQTPYDVISDNAMKKLYEGLVLKIRKEPAKKKEVIQPTLVKGWVFKKRDRLPTFNKRFIVLHPIQGTLIYYKHEEDYPNKPSKIVALTEVRNVKKKSLNALFEKKLHCMQLDIKNIKHILGCHNEDVLDKWINYFQKAIEYTADVEERLKFAMLDETSNFTVLNTCMAAEDTLEEVTLNDHKPRTIQKCEVLRTIQTQNCPVEKQTVEVPLKVTPKPKEKITLESLEIINEIGSGSFGKVYRARKKDDGKIYALKTISKAFLIKENQMSYAISEAKILKKCQHPFIINLDYTFQTQDHLFLVMEYCCGGDLSSHLSKRGNFSENEARLIIAELILAIEYLHSLNILYRDLKPDNILVGSDGHIRLADFGLSKEEVRKGDTAMSFCGSPAYLAPEMLASKGVDRAVDIYGIGTVLYELLSGKPPYYSDNLACLYRNIRTGNLCLPPKLTIEAKNLITTLLNRTPDKRLGACDVAELKKDPFFNGIDWDQVASKRLPPIDPILCQDPHSASCSGTVLGLVSSETKQPSSNNHVENFSFVREF